MKERDSLVAKYKTDLQYQQAKLDADKEIALTQLKNLLEEAKLYGVGKQSEIDKLVVRLEQLELTQSDGNLKMEEVLKGYKLRIKTLEREAAEAMKRFQEYYSELQIKYVK